jgi:predicted Rossmann-fold nucleotide-binding protein
MAKFIATSNANPTKGSACIQFCCMSLILSGSTTCMSAVMRAASSAKGKARGITESLHRSSDPSPHQLFEYDFMYKIPEFGELLGCKNEQK